MTPSPHGLQAGQHSVEGNRYPQRSRGVSGTMLLVILFSLPGTAAMVWFFGLSVLLQIGCAIFGALAAEAIASALLQRSVKRTLSDCSALLAGWLIGLSMPPLVPAWIAVLAGFAGVTIGKQIYGGLGQNIFNPAMVGYAFVLVSFPLEMSLGWPALSGTMDGITGATPLDLYKQARLDSGNTLNQSPAALEWIVINAFFLLGGLGLLIKGLARWQIPTAMLAAFCACAIIAGLLSTHNGPTESLALVDYVVVHLGSGAIMFGAFFIATDPVTAATSRLGQLCFGAGVGILLFMIRGYSAWPDGVAFAVLFMNLCVPLLDHYTRPRTYGYSHRKVGPPT